MPGAQQKPKLLPFDRGTRRRVVTVGQFTFTPGTPVPTVTLPQVGMLSRIFYKIEGAITQTATGTLSVLGYAALISRVRVNANLGSAAIIDASGFGLEVAQAWWAPIARTVQNAYGNAVAANPVSYGGFIPINANDRNLFQLGLINLQAEQIRVTVDVIAAAVTAFLVAGGGTITPALTLYLGYEYWEVPDPTRFMLPPRTLCRLLEDSQAITAVGDNIYVIPRLGTLMQATHYYLNAATPVFLNLSFTSTAAPAQVNELRLRYNKTDTVLDYQMRFKEIDENAFYNQPRVAGVSTGFLYSGAATWDFFHSGGQTRNNGDRDLINTEVITTLESISTVDPTVTLSGSPTLNTVRRVAQRLV